MVRPTSTRSQVDRDRLARRRPLRADLRMRRQRKLLIINSNRALQDSYNLFPNPVRRSARQTQHQPPYRYGRPALPIRNRPVRAKPPARQNHTARVKYPTPEARNLGKYVADDTTPRLDPSHPRIALNTTPEGHPRDPACPDEQLKLEAVGTASVGDQAVRETSCAALAVRQAAIVQVSDACKCSRR